MIDFNEYKKYFDDYAARYDHTDGRVALKIVHTYAVVSVMETLCRLRCLPPHTAGLALLCALFHDIGRFEQLKQYDTFLDHKSVDHASLSCKVLRENHVLDRLPEADREAVLTAIENHNKLRIDPTVTAAASSCPDDAQSLGEPGPCCSAGEVLELCRLIRDADKCDIFRVFATDDMTDVVGASEEKISQETITPKVMEALRDHVSVDRRARKTHLDQWIGFLCFVFDLNYRESIQIVKEQGYYKRPFERTDFKNPAARALVHEALGTVDLYMETFGQTIPDALREFFQDHPKMALAFSGGTDSAYLLYAARACGCHVRAYYAASPFQPAFELEDAKKLAVSLKAEMTILPLNVLELSAVRENPSDRCYHCKNAIFSRILEAAEKDGFLEVMDGTNASDDAGDRPGMRALRELRVLSPLRVCGVTKKALREYSRNAGLFTWNKPAYACLATRVPTGCSIDPEILKKIERAETGLTRLGFSDFRVRVWKDPAGQDSWNARLQLTESQFSLLAGKRLEVLELLKPDFSQVLLDLSARSVTI